MKFSCNPVEYLGRMRLAPIAVLHDDCLKVLRHAELIQDRSINAVITSPPYAMQRAKQYGGIPEKDFPDWMVSVFDAIKPKLVRDGSILMNIRPHLRNGAVSDYVLRTRLSLRDAGWFENEELIWHKPEAYPLGSKKRPRRAYESIHWFSRSKEPYTNMKAMGRISKQVGFGNTKKMKDEGIDKFAKPGRKAGIARVSDVLSIGIGGNARDNPHPATFPPALAFWLIQTFVPKDGCVLDPFAGSGTTILTARAVNRASIGIEAQEKYVRLIEDRIKKIDWAGCRYLNGYESVQNFDLGTHGPELYDGINGAANDVKERILNMIRDPMRFHGLDYCVYGDTKENRVVALKKGDAGTGRSGLARLRKTR